MFILTHTQEEYVGIYIPVKIPHIFREVLKLGAFGSSQRMKADP